MPHRPLVSLRTRVLACNLAAVASFIGLSVAVAVNSTWVWPFLLAGYGYLLGLGNYGVAEEGAPADAAPRPRNPLPSIVTKLK